MDTKLMVATNLGDVKKLKDLPNREDAMATSKEPSKEDQSPGANSNINPLLLASASVGSWQALNVLLEREDAKEPPMVIPTQEFLELLATRSRSSSSAEGRVVAARDVEEGVDHQPAAGALLKGVTPDGDTALHAVARSHKGGQHFLKYAGIIYHRSSDLLFAKNHRGDTPLHCAARAGNFEMASHLIDLAGREGVDRKLKLLRMENKLNETALHEAVRIEDGRILGPKDREALFGADSAPEERIRAFVNQQEERTIVKLLMGADSELANYPADGISPLYLAIFLEKSTIALTLYDRSGGNLSYAGADGQNALHVAVLRDTNTVMVELLLDWDKSLTAQVDKDGNTPLHFASSTYFWTGSYLHLHPLRRPPWCRFVCFPWRSTRAFPIAFEANPAELYQADKNGFFPIHVAASVGAIGIIRFFVRKWPDSVGLRDAKGKTFLHVAIEKERLIIVSYACGDPSLAWILNMQDNDGNTALHLAIQAGSFRMFCALFGNREVNLNLTNNQGETPLDLSRSKIPRGMGYALNSENKISYTLSSVGASHGALRWDKIEEKYSRRTNPEDQDKESERLKDATQPFIVAAVLIATMAFTAAFAIPGGFRADDHANGGTPTLAGGYVFDAFIMATALAFICSLLATTGFMLAGIPMINLITRRIYLVTSEIFFSSSVTCMSIVFALGVYVVLAPVARSTAAAICVITPAILVGKNMGFLLKMIILARPLCIRKGRFLGMVHLLRWSMFKMAITLWPVVVIFGWGGWARIHHGR